MRPTGPFAVLLALAVALALALAACGGDDGGETAETPGDNGAAIEADTGGGEPRDDGERHSDADSAAPDREAERRADTVRDRRPGVEIATADSQFGQVLFDGGDQAIYYFDLEQSSTPECYGSCAAAWPPVLTRGQPRATGEARQGLLGTTERRDGTTQVTYDGRPLYYYVDEAPGELRCHNIFHEGGLWLAVQPDGAAVPHDPAATISID